MIIKQASQGRNGCEPPKDRRGYSVEPTGSTGKTDLLVGHTIHDMGHDNSLAVDSGPSMS